MINLSNIDELELATTIRAVEEKFLSLFEENLLNGTVHTCIGQELSAVSVCKYLNSDDYVFSNHRGHGHYIAFTKDYQTLISELLGKSSGICGGIGGSQHLCNGNFFSNGPQGSLTPVAVGAAKACKQLKNDKIAVCFIGDGTMGEGIIYESMNLASLYDLPILFVCENNQYAQSTPISNNLAGSIFDRAKAFGLNVQKADTWNKDDLFEKTNRVISAARACKPSFLVIETYRLKAHSKGDDDRDENEIKHYYNIDHLNNELKKNENLIEFNKNIKNEIDRYVEQIIGEGGITLESYLGDQNSNKINQITWLKQNPEIEKKQITQINDYFKNILEKNDKVVFIGEDIKDPYGGAFKATKDLTNIKMDNIISTPISEAAIVGMGIGMSLLGFRPVVEIMFGDFISYSFDQILSNASKFYHMFNKQLSIPLIIRTPMGGGRGYGPTHSQTIEKFFIGINNIQIVALNTLIDSKEIYSSIEKYNHTTIVVENKLDYGRLQNKLPNTIEYLFQKSKTDYPIITGLPKDLKPEISIITYGGSVHPSLEAIDEIFYEFEILPKIIVLSKIYPLPIEALAEIIEDTKHIITVEESNIEGGFGSEIIAGLVELCNNKSYCRIGSKNIPIPSTKSLEKKVLINSEDIISGVRKII
ncbi:MAG: pyruvate dehydrogenase [Rhodobiaceae bacterium]|nr:pyruvate dehydrogenase [Rhodobiaceae bacterium]